MTSENCNLSKTSLLESLSLRVNVSSAECLEKDSSSIRDTPTRKAFESHIPRSPLAVSNSCNDALKSDSSRYRGRPSMIPKSKSIKRTEKGNVKIELFVKSEELSAVGKSNKKQLTNETETEKEPDGSSDILKKVPKQESPKEEIKPGNATNSISPSLTETYSKEEFKHVDTGISRGSLKSCVSANELKEERLKNPVYSTTSVKSQLSEYKDAEEDWNNCLTFSREFSEGEPTNEEKEIEKQERGIQTLYETLKSTGSTFDNFKWICEKNPPDNISNEYVPNCNFTVQQCYDMMLEDISEIWKNAVSLISSVKDHASKFIQEKEDANSLDREQLLLEGEMVQLAVDFAINYSKLKSDFLVKSISERLGFANLPKTNLEKFMESKTFAALYNDEDLATMSRTIKDLNMSVLKEEDKEVQ